MKKVQWFWISVLGSVILRFILFYTSKNLNLSSRPEIATPLTSLRRLAEGYWLKQSSMSPYSGSMYHELKDNLIIFYADVVCAMLIRAAGETLQTAYSSRLKLLGLHHLSENSGEVLPSGDLAALAYLWNPFTVVACVGLSTSAIENLMVVLSLYGACKRLAPLAAFGWVMATHLSLYPAILLIPVILLFGYGPDAPPTKLFLQRKKFEVGNSSSSDDNRLEEDLRNQLCMVNVFSWKSVTHFLFWTLLWSSYVLVLCGIYLRQHGGLQELFKRTYGFILTIPDLSPNIGVFWYFFAEKLLPDSIPWEYSVDDGALSLTAESPTMLSSFCIHCDFFHVGDSALYLGLLGLFAYELKDMQFSFFLFSGYVGVSLLSPVMHNLWIWRGTGNANFYFGTAITYACFQIILVVESVSAMLNHDRMLKKLSTAKLVKT
ncbi:hypothetical protein Lal_00041491 [Lupinus albus]|nr:hypothetical protein Lal_00041491 [Lupinus albus]